jgi:hypothetical protein
MLLFQYHGNLARGSLRVHALDRSRRRPECKTASALRLFA